MASQTHDASPKPDGQEPRPSSSVLLLSPTNEILLLHRVKTSTSFASAHVFPGGNLDAFHDGDDGGIPGPGSPERHQDGPGYRMGAIRETFEETGILLATKDGTLVNLSAKQRDEARKNIHGHKVKFGDFLKSIGAVAETAGLIPFTRWITPTSVPKRFTTQMYLYMLPISKKSVPSEMLLPTPDGGVEHTAAQFAPVQSWLDRAAAGSITLFPPQVYLMSLLGRFLTGSTSALEEGPLHYTAQRKKLVSFLRRRVTAETNRGKRHPTATISWADKVMSPYHLLFREEDHRVVLALDKPGPELEGGDRGGDWERVALVKFGKGGPSDVVIRMREEVLAEQRAKPDTRL
ncbi:NUDIX hydrolase domain protein [Metarhizium album ARSEF 1941]|uniref:NUDIX hydrolase domain protein n=1 Tax=Metarhizium album (strain ARSEF 1941) TaxID=1081103 RepID=A0A0B2WL34_METAS|nr:NUDIX hydrolase domain protein [Metarhizium album ARSEF 1941]KHN94663.1 NUDIX hydrolase domain protein [Metarhizium album ARSEF 1941]